MLALRSWPMVLMLLCGSTAALRSQIPGVRIGDRVRLRTSTSPRAIQGVVLRTGVDTLFLAVLGADTVSGTPLLLAADALRSVDVWRGRRSAWREGAEFGSLAGFLVGSTVFAHRTRDCIGLECGKESLWIPEAEAGSVAGAVLGGLIGAALKHDVWVRLPKDRLRPRVAVLGDRAEIGLSLRI